MRLIELCTEEGLIQEGGRLDVGLTRGGGLDVGDHMTRDCMAGMLTRHRLPVFRPHSRVPDGVMYVIVFVEHTLSP